MNNKIILKYSKNDKATTYECDSYMVKRTASGGFRTTMFGDIFINGKKWKHNGGKRYDRSGVPVNV